MAYKALVPHLLPPLIVLLLLLVSEFQTDLSLTVLLSCGTISLLIFVNFLIISLLLHLLSTHLYLDLSTSLSQKAQNSSFSLFFSSAVFIYLDFLWTDISDTDLALFFHLTFMSYHSSPFHSCKLFLFF